MRSRRLKVGEGGSHMPAGRAVAVAFHAQLRESISEELQFKQRLLEELARDSSRLMNANG